MSKQDYDELVSLTEKHGVFDSISELLEWDKETIMPRGASQIREKQREILEYQTHTNATNPRIGEILKTMDRSTFSEEQIAQVREIERNYKTKTCIPAELVKKEVRLKPRALASWKKAREENDFSIFETPLSEFVEIQKQKAHHINKKAHSYQTLLNEYERGFSLEEINTIFSRIKTTCVPLIKQIAVAAEPDTSFLSRDIPEEKQMLFFKEIASFLGFSFEKGRLDISVHPFSSAYGRITTRFTDGWWGAIGSVIHELGHGKYEHNLPFDNFGTPLGNARSLGVHESQSRLWENHVGKSHSFWSGYFGTLKQSYAPYLDDVSFEKFYRAINVVRSDFIRVNADELTYTLHIVIRFEIEKALIEGSLDVKDIPSAWNKKTEEILGITPPNDTLGCLQDIHWGYGEFGYFPTYTIGSMLAAQLWNAAKREIPFLDSLVYEGNFSPLNNWLEKKIHRHGCRYSTKELIYRATGKEPSVDDYVSYLYKKFSNLYSLDS